MWSKFGSGNRDTLTKAARELKKQGKLTNGSSSAILSAAATPLTSRCASPAPSVASTNSEADADGGTVGRETRRRLMDWWSKEYCASRMRLCVYGKGMVINAMTRFFLLMTCQNRWTSWPAVWLLYFRLSPIAAEMLFQCSLNILSGQMKKG